MKSLKLKKKSLQALTVEVATCPNMGGGGGGVVLHC